MTRGCGRGAARRRLAAGGALLLALAACAPERPRSTAGPVELSARFQPGPAATAIEIFVLDTQPLDGAELIAPDGRMFPSAPIRSLARDRDHGIRPGIGVGVSGGSASRTSTAIGISLPIFGFGGSGGPPLIESRTRLVVPDMAEYRAGWQQWQVRLRLGSPFDDGRSILFGAPPPPD